jgi:FdhD protein
VVTVTLRVPARRTVGARYGGMTAASSACGVCGTETIDEVFATLADRVSPTAGPALAWDVVRRMPEAMREHQQLFDRTGGLHAAALFSPAGDLLVLREDVGRHNAVDKVVGARVLAGLSPAVPLLCVSGRIGFEIVQKAVVADIGVLAAVGAPSSLAVDLASRAGLCTAGFVRDERYVVYSAADRLGV